MTVACSFVVSFVLLKVVNALMGARASEHEERVGLDLTGHRESATRCSTRRNTRDTRRTQP